MKYFKKKIYIIIFIFIALSFLSMSVLSNQCTGYTSATGTEQESEDITLQEETEAIIEGEEELREDVVEEKTVAGELSENNGVAIDKVFYTKDNNIFSYDISTEETLKCTDYTKNKDYYPAYDETGEQIPDIEISDIKVIDENTVGFSKSESVKGDFGFGIYTLDLKTKEITSKKKLEGDMMILALDFASPDKFSYVIDSSKEWQQLLFDNGDLQILQELTPQIYGRGGIIEDCTEIKFSPDGKYVLQIETSSPRSVEDFNVYVFNLSDSSEQVITGATQPEWLDNSTIVYRKYEKDGDGLYLYSLKTNINEKIDGINKSSYKPEVLTGTSKVLYTVYPGKQIWLYDVNTGENIKILDNALYGYWVNHEKIIYYELDPDSEMDEMGGYDFKSVSLFDLETKSKISSIPEMLSIWCIDSLY